MSLLSHALRLSGLTHGRSSCSFWPRPIDVVPMVPDLIKDAVKHLQELLPQDEEPKEPEEDSEKDEGLSRVEDN
jgi:hypothetical protein